MWWIFGGILWGIICFLVVAWALLKEIGHNFGRKRSEVAEALLGPGRALGIKHGLGLVGVAWGVYSVGGWVALWLITRGWSEP